MKTAIKIFFVIVAILNGLGCETSLFDFYHKHDLKDLTLAIMFLSFALICPTLMLGVAQNVQMNAIAKCTPKNRIGHTTKIQCGKKHRSGFVCTRRRGHKGKHIACGILNHNYAVW